MRAVEILYQDRSVIVINKPAGLPVLPDGWEPEAPFLMRLLEAEYGRVWIVHRLDKVTSGALVVARTAEAHRALSIEFERHGARKIYHAIVNGNPDWDARQAGHPLLSNVGHKHRTIVDSGKGKPSRTEFVVMERFRNHALLEAQPVTGRTHQVRAHAAALRVPLLGDSLYGAPRTELIGRPALHAYSLTFTQPESGEAVTYTAPPPKDFLAALRALRAGRSRPRK